MRGIQQIAEFWLSMLLVFVLWSMIGGEAGFVKYELFCFTCGNAIVNVHQAAKFVKLNVNTVSNFQHT